MSAAHDVQQFLRGLADASRTLDDFELWLLHRAYRPDEFEDAKQCGDAWHLLREFKATWKAVAGD